MGKSLPTARPKWLTLTDNLLGPLLAMTEDALKISNTTDTHLNALPLFALMHLAESLESSMSANERGAHSVAICLVRQSIEALTVVELGLLPETMGQTLLSKWESSKKGHGEIRATLESKVWPAYGSGLWDEPWSAYFGNLAKAVQPYAHYTPNLMHWQWAVLDHDGLKRLVIRTGPRSYDPLKASRITLFHSLIGWTLGRLLLENGKLIASPSVVKRIREWGDALSTSNLLFKRKNWGDELAGLVLFKEGVDRHDP